MNNPKPIKRHQALVAFSRDHHFGLLLVWKIKQGLDKAVAPERISNYVLYFFEHDLQPHFEEEEQLLFPRLPADSELRRQAEKEHAIIKDLIVQIQNDKSNKSLLLKFSVALNDHIRFEERELFTAIQQVSSEEDLSKIEMHGNNRGNEADAGWKDVFWSKSADQHQTPG